MLKEEIKWNRIKCSVDPRECIKRWGEKTKNKRNEQEKVTNIVDITLSTATLNANGLNTPIQRHIFTVDKKIQDPTICCLQETQFICKGKRKSLKSMMSGSF